MTTVQELNQTIQTALDSGKIGTPVCLRASVQLNKGGPEPIVVLAACTRMAEALFEVQPAKLTARQTPDASQLNLIVEFAAGQTLSLSIGRGAVNDPDTNLLLIGNHGIIRLEGGDTLEQQSWTADASEIERWRILERNGPVAII